MREGQISSSESKAWVTEVSKVLREKSIGLLEVNGKFVKKRGLKLIPEVLGKFFDFRSLTMDERSSSWVYKAKVNLEGESNPVSVNIVSLGKNPPHEARHIVIDVPYISRIRVLDVGGEIMFIYKDIVIGKAGVTFDESEEVEKYRRILNMIETKLSKKEA